MPLIALSRDEYIADIQLTTQNREYELPTNGGLLPRERFMSGLRLMFEGRLTNAASGNPTGILADAPYSAIDYIKVQGYHKPRIQDEIFINLRGADLRELTRIYTGHDPLSLPASLNTGASATNDIRFILEIPFVPLALPPRQKIGYLLDAPNYDRLKLLVKFADDKSVFSGQTTASTWSAYGSSAGSPRIRVDGLFALGGTQQFRGFVPARLWRTYVEVAGSEMTNTNSNVRLYGLPRGYRLRSVLIKTGVKGTGVTAPNVAFATLSDAILANLKVMHGLNRPIRFYPDCIIAKEESGMTYSLRPNTGYVLVDFAAHGTLSEALQTAGMMGGPSGDIDLNVTADVTGAANQAAVFIMEELRGSPAMIGRATTRTTRRR